MDTLTYSCVRKSQAVFHNMPQWAGQLAGERLRARCIRASVWKLHLFLILVAACNSKIPLRFALARSCAHTAFNTFLA